MPSESKPLLAAQTEKPNHYKYLKEFRVEQCPSFLQHKCTQHRPFTCFHWHFNNQRRRRPVRKRDGSFNYSADNYCTKYNETSGICEDGDECPYLHRTAGDTERRYHLRYYKTCMCVHDTDARGQCAKNGAHCAFAHGAPDLRPPVLDARELLALDPDAPDHPDAPNALDKERNLMNEDPKWQDTNYVLSSYKTEPCKRPPRLCRQGYACPQYHNSKDKRRSPRKYKYRSTPCPNVKHGEEWGEPSNCEAGDGCGYCHTRTEQQFHPEIYKSTKCNDVQQAGYCPRGLFCAFAHVEPEDLSAARELAAPLECGTNLAELLSSALPPDKKVNENSVSMLGNVLSLDRVRPLSPAGMLQTNGSGDGSECASTSSGGSSGGRAPGPRPAPLQPPQDKPLSAVWPQRASTFDATVLQEVVGNALDDLHLEDPLNLVASLDRDLSDGEGLLGGSAPVNIPQARPAIRGFSPPAGGSPLTPFLRYAQNDTERLFNSHAVKAGSFGAAGAAPFEYSATSPSAPAELSRLREELVATRAAAVHWDERIAQARSACEAWQRETDEAQRKAALAERQRDDALAHAMTLRRELESARAGAMAGVGLAGAGRRELRGLPINTLKDLLVQARADLEEIEKVLYLETATKCMVCEEQPRSVTLGPCNHYVLCEGCSATTKECPYCQTPVQQQHH
ncbi:putative E3 ubiquitin-protein ligase UNKL isoform X1 [Galleria mellonella]|uniref:E3 ubiquitin-protein ligase UNKL isoform X1 n=2 Tax=Galleria mellonella TaxID=7137 RepID=A0ABM3N7C2_GALME|nr:putative E3 ubiquitin-protein ligase UNKL isoform X1 [Galleria mellonella]